MINNEWYNLNENSCWPLTDTATCIADDGSRLPNNILCDLNIWFPDYLGNDAYIGAVTVSGNIVTVIILVEGTEVTPVAAVSVVAPINKHTQYPLSPLINGVSGYIVLGSGAITDKLSSFKFSNKEQSLLLPHISKTYKVPPVTGIKKLNTTDKLTGIVRLAGGDDVEIVKETREINSIVRDVAVIRLKADQNLTNSYNIFEKYISDCGKRPESRNCNKTPIEYINSVQPDCCGNITIELRGCADVKFIQNETCSVAIGCNFGLSEACVTPDRLPDSNGILPNEYNDLCVEESIISSLDGAEYSFDDIRPLSSHHLLGGPELSIKEKLLEDLNAGLPFIEDFSNNSFNDFKIIRGKAQVVPDMELALYGGYSIQSQLIGDFVSVCQAPVFLNNWSDAYKKITLNFSLRKSNTKVHNGGLVFNYLNNNNFWAVELDHEGLFTGIKSLRLVKYSDSGSTTHTVLPIKLTALNLQYTLALSIFPGVDGGAWVSVTITNNLDKEDRLYLNATLGPFFIANYDHSGYFGIIAHQATTQFNRLIVENI